MKKSLIKLVVIVGLLIQAMSINPAFATEETPSEMLQLGDLPEEILLKIATNLDLRSLSEGFGRTNKRNHSVAEDKLTRIKARLNYINENLDFILLPEVTEADVEELGRAMQAQAAVTAITQAMPSFLAARSKTSVGLYAAVMGHFPDLTRTYFSDQRKAAILAQWKDNPDLPVTYTASDEDKAFAQRLSQITGRNFRIMNNAENEYSIRGRVLVDGSPIGKITTSTFHFGFDASQLSTYAWMLSNSENKVRGVHENPAGHQHSFGLNQAIGNIYSRSSEGVLFGGAFESKVWNLKSIYTRPDCARAREAHIGSRLVEDL